MIKKDSASAAVPPQAPTSHSSPGSSLSPVVGTYDNAPGPVQMAAVHMALVAYFGTYDWLQERDRRFPAAYRYTPSQPRRTA